MMPKFIMHQSLIQGVVIDIIFDGGWIYLLSKDSLGGPLWYMEEDLRQTWLN
jgi:hypothetical protein